MISIFRPNWRAALATVAVLILGAIGHLLASGFPVARAASVAQLRQQISAGQSRISDLAGSVSATSSQLAQLNSDIAVLQHQIDEIQAKLASERATLRRLRRQLDTARERLKQLEAFDARAETALSAQLVNSYETDRPDIVSVVLNSNGFQDLLNQLSFAKRIQRHDVHVVIAVRAARRAVAAQATRLGALELRQQILTTQVLDQRNALASTKAPLVRQQLALARARDVQASQLSKARGEVAGLLRRLTKFESAAGAAAQPVSAGGFAFPLPKSAASPPGTWSPDDGVDISAPGGTPEYAVCSGTIVLHGIGGFGPWAPVLHCDGSVDGYGYVYYGHAGPANQLPVGTHVSAGEVMSEVGPGIVGISTGPHIEIGFSDSSGSPLGPGTAGAMMSLLQSAY